MSRIKTLAPGIAVSALIAVVCWFLGQAVPLVGGAVFAILLGMVIGTFWKQKGAAGPGDQVRVEEDPANRRGAAGLRIAADAVGPGGSYVAARHPVHHLRVADHRGGAVPRDACARAHATLIGVGSSICGGSAIAATAPVIKADDQEVAHAISVVFLFNVLAALIFPTLGDVIGLSNNGFGLFAGTAVNDTSSVTAAAAVWDGMHPGANALDYATIVKLTRTLAIIPITFALALWVSARERKQAAQNGADTASTSGFSLKRALPTFIVLFVCASLVATGASAAGVDPAVFAPLKTLSKFFIVVAMAAIGLNTDVVGLVKSGAKPIVLGAACWVAIACTSLAAQHALGLW